MKDYQDLILLASLMVALVLTYIIMVKLGAIANDMESEIFGDSFEVEKRTQHYEALKDNHL